MINRNNFYSDAANDCGAEENISYAEAYIRTMDGFDEPYYFDTPFNTADREVYREIDIYKWNAVKEITDDIVTSKGSAFDGFEILSVGKTDAVIQDQAEIFRPA